MKFLKQLNFNIARGVILMFLRGHAFMPSAKMITRSSRSQVFFKISQISQENSCVAVYFQQKTRLQHWCFPVKFAKF